MRTIELSSRFKKDFKRVSANPRYADLELLLNPILSLLVADKPLPENCRDHFLIGNWKDYRECHVKPDLLLIYKTKEPGVLRLARLSSHSELFSR